MPAVLIRASALVAALAMVGACDQAKESKSAPAPAPAPTAPAPAPTATPTPAPAPAPPAPATAPPRAFTATPSASRCDGPIRHADQVLRTTGAPSLVAALLPTEDAIAQCEREQWSDEVLACAAIATDAHSLIYDCYARAFGDAPLQIKRRFHALEDNRGVSPSPGSVDGDYIAVDDQCGSYTRSAPPAYGVYYLCGDSAQGPFMTGDDIRALYAAIATDEANRHDIVTSLVAKTRIHSTRVDVYDERGTYQGTHTDF